MAVLCEREQITLGPPSTGAISDDEFVLRVAYDPKHYDPKKGHLTKEVIRNKDLLSGELSVWRLPADDVGRRKLISDFHSNTPHDNKVRGIAHLHVALIRSLRGSDGKRLFCVRDDTKIDLNGGKDGRHAVIGFCCYLDDEYKIVTSNLYQYAKNLLYSHIRNAIENPP